MTNLQCYVWPQLTGVVISITKCNTAYKFYNENENKHKLRTDWEVRWSLLYRTAQNTFYIYWLLPNSRSQGHTVSWKCDPNSVLVFGIFQLTKTCFTLLNSHRVCQPYQHYPAYWMIYSASRDIWPDAHGITQTNIILSKCLIQKVRKGFNGLLNANFENHTKTEIMGCVISLSRSFQSSEVSDHVHTSETNLLITTEVLCLSAPPQRSNRSWYF